MRVQNKRQCQCYSFHFSNVRRGPLWPFPGGWNTGAPVHSCSRPVAPVVGLWPEASLPSSAVSQNRLRKSVTMFGLLQRGCPIFNELVNMYREWNTSSALFSLQDMTRSGLFYKHMCLSYDWIWGQKSLLMCSIQFLSSWALCFLPPCSRTKC